MNSVLKQFYLVALVITLLSCQHDKQPPNIIFILSDDHSVGSISAYGNSLLETPNIDKLADQGMRFNNCFAVVSICGPSRAAILSGKYGVHNGYMRNGDSFERNQQTFPKLLKQSGYQTAVIGKWHLGTQPAGFDYYSVIPYQGQFFDSKMKETGKEWQDGREGGITQPGYLTEVITDKAIDWLKTRDKKKPFCLLVHHKAPHEPYDYPKRYKELLAQDTIPEPANFNDTFEGKNDALENNECSSSKFENMKSHFFQGQMPEDVKKGTPEFKSKAYQIAMKGYHRLVAALDDNIGRLMDFVDDSSLDNNTIVVYTSDNGWFLGDHGLFNKMWMYEESLHVPLIVRYPGNVKPATVSDEFVSTLDFAPTFLDYAGIEKNKQFQGKSIKPVLNNNTPDDWKSVHFYHYFGQFEVPAHYGIRTKYFKLIYFYEAEKGPKWELYDLKKDPTEMVNLIHNPKYQDVFSDMKTLLQEKKKEAEDTEL